MKNEDSYLSVGKIVGSHGIRGNVKVRSHSGDLSDFSQGVHLLTRCADGRREMHTVQWSQFHSRHIVLALDGVDDRNHAEALKGCELFVRRKDMPALSQNTYFWEDIIGLTVVTPDQRQLGVVKTIIPTGSNDVYVVENPATGEEILLPAIQTVIRKIDPVAGLMEVVLPEII